MAVRIINEAAFDAEFNRKMDKEWDKIQQGLSRKTDRIKKDYEKQRSELINNYYKDRFDNPAFELTDITSNKKDYTGKLVIDKVTGKLIYNRLLQLLKENKFDFSNSLYKDSESNIADAIENSMAGVEDIELCYNGIVKGTKTIEHKLAFNKDKSGKPLGKDGLYKCYFDFNVFIRSGLYELNDKEMEDSVSSNLFEILIISNMPKFTTLEEPDRVYKEALNLIQKSISQTSTEEYWDVNEESSFTRDDFKFIK